MGNYMRLKGKTAIVTGAASGFGAGIARKFSNEGAHVIVADLNFDGAQKSSRKAAKLRRTRSPRSMRRSVPGC